MTDVALTRNAEAFDLDATDRHLVELLLANSRISNRDLARQVGLSAPAALRRVQRLTSRGVIRRFTVELGTPSTGLTAFVGIRLNRHATASLTEFEDRVRAIPAVSSAFQVTGGFDYLLRVEVRDLAQYRHFHTEQLAGIAGVAHVTSFIVITDLAN